jgi:hypothetical protein
MTEEDKEKKREEDKMQKRQQQQSMNETDKINQREKSKDRMCKKRNDERQRLEDLLTSNRSALEDNVIKTFMNNIRNGPTYACSICYRMLYRTSVKHLNDTLRNKIQTLSLVLASGTKDWICVTCSNYVSKNKIPPQARSNNMALVESPEKLKVLCCLEKQLISKIIPFMKIFSLPKGSQHGLKGQVVLVPSDIKGTARSLPRDTQDAQLIALNLKRRLSDKSAYCKEFIRPKVVNEALQYLMNINEHYSDITHNDTWTEDSRKHDESLWNVVHHSSDNGERL